MRAVNGRKNKSNFTYFNEGFRSMSLLVNAEAIRGKFTNEQKEFTHIYL